MNTYPTASYANGRPYTPLHARLASSVIGLQSSVSSPQSSASPHNHFDSRLSTFDFSLASLDWTGFWQLISAQLQASHYAEGTRAQYRSILRSFYRHARRRPAETTSAIIHEYIVKLTEKNYSWSWIGMNISILRTVFDKLAGQAITRHFVTPKRPKALPEILSQNETRALLAAADTTRDQLLLGLLYGCGLKLSELRNLTWSAVDAGRLHLHGREARTLEIPHELVPVLDYGKSRCLPADYIFQGRYGGAPLSARMIELTIRRARNAAGILKPVTAMTLRHTYAVHCLENGESIRELQHALGHQHIKTTMLYTRCILPPNLESPLDPIKRQQRQTRPQPADYRPQTEICSSQPTPKPNRPLPESSVFGLQSSVSPHNHFDSRLAYNFNTPGLS
jgi:site-specific recombinase XerD